MDSLACPHCTTTESHKFFCKDGPQIQQLFELFWVVHQTFWVVHHVFGPCRYKQWEQVLLFNKMLYSKDQLNPQSYELIAISLFYCRILYHLENFVVSIFENIEFYIQVTGILFGRGKSSKSVLAFTEVPIVGTSKLVKGSSSVVSHGLTRSIAGSWKKWFIFVNES